MTFGNHWSGPSSAAAVIHMQTKRSRKSGLPASFHISAVDTFDATRSVFGYSCDSAIARYTTAGTRMVPSFICQLALKRFVIATASRPPITRPPGHHACSMLSRLVF